MNFQNPYIPQPAMSLERVASIDEARRYRCYPGATVYLLDQEQPMIYMKTCDQAGNCSLRAFSLTEVSADSVTDPRYISRNDFEAFKKEMMEAIRGGMRDEPAAK